MKKYVVTAIIIMFVCLCSCSEHTRNKTVSLGQNVTVNHVGWAAESANKYKALKVYAGIGSGREIKPEGTFIVVPLKCAPDASKKDYVDKRMAITKQKQQDLKDKAKHNNFNPSTDGASRASDYWILKSQYTFSLVDSRGRLFEEFILFHERLTDYTQAVTFDVPQDATQLKLVIKSLPTKDRGFIKLGF
jgi:hypothetical protein